MLSQCLLSQWLGHRVLVQRQPFPAPASLPPVPPASPRVLCHSSDCSQPAWVMVEISLPVPAWPGCQQSQGPGCSPRPCLLQHRELPTSLALGGAGVCAGGLWKDLCCRHPSALGLAPVGGVGARPRIASPACPSFGCRGYLQITLEPADPEVPHPMPGPPSCVEAGFLGPPLLPTPALASSGHSPCP